MLKATILSVTKFFTVSLQFLFPFGVAIVIIYLIFNSYLKGHPEIVNIFYYFVTGPIAIAILAVLFTLYWQQKVTPSSNYYLLNSNTMELKGRVTVYSIVGCPHCMRAKNTLSEHQLPYTDISVDKFEGARQEMKDKTGGKVTVP